MNSNAQTHVNKWWYVITLLTGFVFLLQSCDNEDPGPKGVLLEVNIAPDYFPDNYDIWMFISDANGNTIDVRQATDSTHLKFSGHPRGSMTLTVFKRVAFTDSGNGRIWNSFGFETFQEIAAGSTFDFVYNPNGNSSSELTEVIGTTPFTVSNYNDSAQPRDAFLFSDGVSSPYGLLDYNAVVYTGGNFSSQLRLKKNPSRILATTYRNGVPVHKWLDDVKPAEPLALDFDSFVPSKMIGINKPVAAGGIKANNLANGYMLSDLNAWQLSRTSDLTKPPSLGYLEGFEKYYVSVYSRQFHEKDNVYYTKVGALPQSINIPDFTYRIEDTSLYGLSLYFSNEYTAKQAYFITSNSDTQVNWSLYASAERFKAPLVPAEIRKLYPMLSVSGLTLEVAAYSYWPDGFTYGEFIREIVTLNRRDEYEELRYVVMPEN